MEKSNVGTMMFFIKNKVFKKKILIPTQIMNRQYQNITKRVENFKFVLIRLENSCEFFFFKWIL